LCICSEKLTSGYAYTMSLEMIFRNTFLSESTIRAQILAAIQFYASQSDLIYATIPSGYSHKNINATAIENSLKITFYSQTTTAAQTTITSTLSTPVTYTANLPGVLALTTSSTDPVDPNVAFSGLTALVKSILIIFVRFGGNFSNN
jgi:hypothetical protein